MFKFAVFVCLAVAVFAFPADDDEKYTSKYDNVDLDSILSNKKLVGSYVNCLLDQGKCTPDGQELRKVLPDALTNECKKCTDKQKEGVEKVLKYLVNDDTANFVKLMDKFDPKKEYLEKYKVQAKEKYGIDVEAKIAAVAH